MAKRKERAGEYWTLDDCFLIHIHDLFRGAVAARKAAGDAGRGKSFTYDGGDLRHHLRERKPGRISEIIKARPDLALVKFVDGLDQAKLPEMLTWRMCLGADESWLEIEFNGKRQRWALVVNSRPQPVRHRGKRMVKIGLLNNVIGAKVESHRAFVLEAGIKFGDLFITLDGRIGTRAALVLPYAVQNVARTKHVVERRANREKVIRYILQRRRLKMPDEWIAERAAEAYWHFPVTIGERGGRYYDDRPTDGMRKREFNKLNDWLADDRRCDPPKIRRSFGPQPPAPYRNGIAGPGKAQGSLDYEIVIDPPITEQKRQAERAAALAAKAERSAEHDFAMRLADAGYHPADHDYVGNYDPFGVGGLVPPPSSLAMRRSLPASSARSGPSSPSSRHDAAALAELESVFETLRRNRGGGLR